MMRQVIFAAALFAAGCGRDPDFACDIVQTQGGVTSHGCSEIQELDDSLDGQTAGLCSQLHGTLVDSCSSDGDLGTCSATQGGITIDNHFYSDGGLTGALAEEACKLIQGTWTPS